MKYINIPITNGIIIKRNILGNVITNVQHNIVFHSPTGFEFGYGGSGPADLALNIVDETLKLMHFHGPRIKINKEYSCYDITLDIYQDFKHEFIATIKGNKTVLSFDKVKNWIVERING